MIKIENREARRSFQKLEEQEINQVTEKMVTSCKIPKCQSSIALRDRDKVKRQKENT